MTKTYSVVHLNVNEAARRYSPDELEQVGVGKSVNLKVKHDGSQRSLSVEVADIGKNG